MTGIIARLIPSNKYPQVGAAVAGTGLSIGASLIYSNPSIIADIVSRDET